MRYGIVFANVMQFGTAEGARAIGSAAEETGFDSVWTVEHVVVPKGYQSEYPYSPNGKMPGPEDSPIVDSFIWLAYLAATTSTLKLATGVAILPQRSVIYTAKEIATLDQLTRRPHRARHRRGLAQGGVRGARRPVREARRRARTSTSP